jgi:LacI family transcriptional regulator
MALAETTTRTTLLDVARTAGVSVATVDRVLNGRAGVRARSVERVHAAVQQLNYRPDPAAARLARHRLRRVAFVLPSGTNSFIALLREQIAGSRVWLQDHRAVVELVEVDVFEPQQVASAIAGLQGRCDAAIVMAMDHPLVRNAIGELDRGGIPVVTLVSDVPSSARVRYVGIDNVAAGRTAGTLLGRFCSGKGGTVGVLVGSPALRDHAERVFGFTQVLREHYPELVPLPPLEGKDDSRRTEKLTAKLLAQQRNLVAIYSAGAGNRGISAALRAAGRQHEVVYIAHELTPQARLDLLDGTLDAVINQDAGHEVRSALRLALAHLNREAVQDNQERIRIDIYLRDNLP